MVIGNFEWMACFTLILLALMFAPFYIRSGVRTLPEFMERRYCPAARTFLAFIGLVGALLIHIGISLFAAAKLFESFLGVPMVATIVVLSLFTVIYTALGGLKAVVVTENVQVCLLLGRRDAGDGARLARAALGRGERRGFIPGGGDAGPAPHAAADRERAGPPQ